MLVLTFRASLCNVGARYIVPFFPCYLTPHGLHQTPARGFQGLYLQTLGRKRHPSRRNHLHGQIRVSGFVLANPELLKTSPRVAQKRPFTYSRGMSYADIITIEFGKRGGKPCIRGLRITVYDVLEYLASGMSHAEVLQEFPYLTEEDIRACLAYTADRERRLQIYTFRADSN